MAIYTLVILKILITNSQYVKQVYNIAILIRKAWVFMEVKL